MTMATIGVNLIPPTRRSRSRDRDRGYPSRKDQPRYGGPAYGSGDADFLER
jgi:hypothetical protein